MSEVSANKFKFYTDFMKNLESPTIFIAHSNKEIITNLAVYENLSLTFSLNSYNTLSFKVYSKVDGKDYEPYKELIEMRFIMLQGIGWYEIHVSEQTDGASWWKEISANSIEIMLARRNLVNFEINSGEIDDDDYDAEKDIVQFYQPGYSKGSLLHRILDVSANWTINHVDDSLYKLQRSFDIESQDVYSFLTGNVSEQFQCLFLFDTFNMTVNAYDLKTYGKDANIFVSTENLANNMEVTVEENSIVTCFRVYGDEGILINEVNPNGSDKIYNFSYFLNEMTPSLRTKVISYNNKYNELMPTYEQIMKDMSKNIEELYDLNYATSDNDEPDTDAKKKVASNWSVYGLEILKSKYAAYEAVVTTMKAQGMDKSGHLMKSEYDLKNAIMTAIKTALDTKQTAVTTKETAQKAIIARRQAIENQLKMSSYFTEAELKELDSYVIEETYDNSNFSTTDRTTDAERFEIEKQLFEKAKEELAKKSIPRYQYSSTLYNILAIPEFKDFLQYFELGNYITVETNYDKIIKMRLIGFELDFDNLETMKVTFSDRINENDPMSDISSIIESAASYTSGFKFNKSQYDKIGDTSNYVEKLRTDGLDVALTQIKNASDQSLVIDETGALFRKYDAARDAFDGRQIKIINNNIVFTDDGFEHCKMAIGQIFIGNTTDAHGNSIPNYGYGINAEVLMSRLILSEQLHIENKSGSYTMTDDGFIATKAVTSGGVITTNRIVINPGKSEELFSIYKKVGSGTDTKQMYINNDGDVVFKGKITGGSIDIGSGAFKVDSSGNVEITKGKIEIGSKFKVENDGSMTATSAKFSGDITSSAIKSSSIEVKDSAGNVNFSVNGTTGKMTAKSGSFSGNITASDISIGGKFHVDTNGNLTASSANITGTINSTSGSIGGWTIGSNSLTSSLSKIEISTSTGGILINGDTINFTNSIGTCGINGTGIRWDSLSYIDRHEIVLDGQKVATQHWVSNVGFATQSWVNSQGFLKESDGMPQDWKNWVGTHHYNNNEDIRNDIDTLYDQTYYLESQINLLWGRVESSS